MGELIAQALSIARGMWRRRWIGVAVAWLVAIAGVVFLARLADRYEAAARVYVDTKTVLRPLMRDLAVEPDIDQTIGLLARTLITRPNVELLMKRTNLDALAETPQQREGMIERLMTKDIRLSGGGRDNVFSFSYRDTEPLRARLMVENLVALFLESDQSSKRRDTEGARTFIDEQIKGYESRLAEAENRLKEFKLRNLGITDATGRDYFARIATLTDEINNLVIELRASEQSRDALRRELEGETVTLVPEVPTAPIVLRSPEIEARLDGQRKQLDDLLRRYTDLHPDVIAVRRLIASLEDERQKFEVEARRRAAEEAKTQRAPVTVTSPVMQRVKFAMAEAEASVASLRTRVGDLQARLAQLRAMANRVPQVEAELAQLNRDYDVVRRNYEALVAQREKATMSEDVDATRLAQFRVIDPPRVAPNPVFPNRLALAPLALLAAIAAGMAASFLASQLMPTFDHSRLLASVTQRPVLGSVSIWMNPAMTWRRRWQNAAFTSAFGSLLVASAAGIAWLTMLARS